MKEIEKKILPEYFQAILDGKKTFELRLDDFEIAEGDTLVLKEWNPEVKNYTGRELERKVGYVNRFKINELTRFYTKEEIDEKGIQIISLL